MDGHLAIPKKLACLIFAMLVFTSSSSRGDMITTMFAANNGQAGNMFDIDVTAPLGIDVFSFDLNLDPGTWNINLYTRDGTHVGFEGNSAAWTLHDSVTGLASAGFDNPTNWDFLDLNLTSGPQAFYVEVTNGFGLNYTNGTGVGNLVVDDGNVRILEGTGNQSNFGNQFRPRIWNGTIHYAVPEPQTLLGVASLLIGSCLVRRRRHG